MLDLQVMSAVLNHPEVRGQSRDQQTRPKVQALNPGSLSTQPVEFPADRDKPDWEEQTVDYVARADNGSKGLTDDAQSTSHDAQIGNAFRKDALQHDEREDQNAERSQDTGG